MHIQRLRDSYFVVGIAFGVLVLVMLFWSHSATTAEIGRLRSEVAQLESEKAKESIEFAAALREAHTHLKGGDFPAAFDLIMVAARTGPSDPRLFDCLLDFAKGAGASGNDDAIALAEELLDRGDSFVYFQSPDDVLRRRKELTEARQKFSAPVEMPSAPDPYGEVKRLLDAGERDATAVDLNSKAAGQARIVLDEILLDRAISGAEHNTEEVTVLLGRLDKIEEACLAHYFVEVKSRTDEWIAAAQDLIRSSDTISSDQVPDVSKGISALVEQGFERLQEITPYSKSHVAGAADSSRSVERQLKELQRWKVWLYNQQALRLIREIESNGWKPDVKIQHLADIEEDLLTPYVLRRHNELWEKVFEELPNEDAKVLAVKRRILRKSQQ